MIPQHILDAAHELADAAVNPVGYADNGDEANRRAERRDKLEAALIGVVSLVVNGGGVEPCPACGSTEPDCEENCEVRIETRNADMRELRAMGS